MSLNFSIDKNSMLEIGIDVRFAEEQDRICDDSVFVECVLENSLRKENCQVFLRQLGKNI